MKEAVTVKCTQNPDLADFLIHKGENELVEAAPTYHFWGEHAWTNAFGNGNNASQ